MDSEFDKNNRVYLMGEIVSEARFSHEIYGEGFYEFYVKALRPSGEADVLPVTVSERLIDKHGLRTGGMISALGELRSYNKIEGEQSRLMHTVLVREIVETDPSRNPNSIILSGKILRRPYCRTMSSGRKEAGFLVTIGRRDNMPDFILCAALDENALIVRELKVKDRVALSGRIQRKVTPEGPLEDVYEVLANKIIVLGENDDFDLEKEFDLFAFPNDNAES